MNTYRVTVSYSTHDDLKDGMTVIGYAYFHLAADSEVQATLIAAQTVAAQGFMPTRTTLHR